MAGLTPTRPSAAAPSTAYGPADAFLGFRIRNAASQRLRATPTCVLALCKCHKIEDGAHDS